MSSLQALVSLYSFYDQLTCNMPVACGPGCATCCSINVSVTSLEVAYLLQHPVLADMGEIIQKDIETAAENNHFIPTCTTNQQAQLCLAREEPMVESGQHGTGRCPLLDARGMCKIYDNRPFSCRAMLSTRPCRQDGEASMVPFIYSVNLAMYQLIEHLDHRGTSGNMLDMLTDRQAQLIANREIPGFFVDPSERVRFQRLLDKLKTIPTAHGFLADFFPQHIFQLNETHSPYN